MGLDAALQRHFLTTTTTVSQIGRLIRTVAERAQAINDVPMIVNRNAQSDSATHAVLAGNEAAIDKDAQEQAKAKAKAKAKAQADKAEEEKKGKKETPRTCAGILLAAGFGRRFASHADSKTPTNKLLACLPDGSSLAEVCARALRETVDWPLAVTRPHHDDLVAVLQSAGCEVIETHCATAGMGASLAAAMRVLMASAPPHCTTALIALADMPWIKAETYRAVMQASARHAIVVPTYKGRRGHPVAFDRTFWGEVGALTGDAGARSVLHRHTVFELPTDDAGILRDVDVPEDLI